MARGDVCGRGAAGLTLRCDRSWSYKHFSLHDVVRPNSKCPRMTQKKCTSLVTVCSLPDGNIKTWSTWNNSLKSYAVDHRTFKRHKCTLLDRVIRYKQVNTTAILGSGYSKRVGYNRETHSGRTFVGHVQRLMDRETFTDTHSRDTFGYLNSTYNQGQENILMQFSGRI